MRLLVTGAAGQLGRAVVEEFSLQHEVVPTTVEDLDIRDAAVVRRRLEAVRPAAVVNCAAYTDVDGSEDDPVTALEVNAFAVRGLAMATADVGAILVHYSTDFVFDGRSNRPYTEEDQPNPRSTYACSKLLGEWFAASNQRHYVLRVESLFGAPVWQGETRRTSIDSIIDAVEGGRSVRVFQDRTVSPSYVPDVAAATRALVEGAPAFGLYHCVNSGSCTWPELALEVGRQLGLTPELRRTTMAEARLRAERPSYCALSNSRLASAGISIRPWQDAVSAHLSGRRRAAAHRSPIS
jgi:dTDP-4-dehydrorhamnose reductase